MHLLAAQTGSVEDGKDPIDLAQSPGDIIVLTSADTEIAGLAKAYSAVVNEQSKAHQENAVVYGQSKAPTKKYL